ncbi:MAG TPA: MFS transporter [Miltoncostaea sp.]|nr:MFS transporter [Miltoncostaea sp.]
MSPALRQRLLLPVLFLVTCVVAVVSSLGAPLVPLVSRDLDVSLSDAQWSLTATLLMGAVSAPIMGRLGDGRRRREAIAIGVLVVLAGCALAAVTSSLPLLVAGRAMQGVGLGLVPLAMAAARDGLPAHRVGPAIALLSVAAAAGVGAGYPISGLIAEHLGLSAAYWFGAAFSAVALAALLPVVPRSSAASGARLDGRGAVLLSVGLVALLLAIGQGESWGWTSAAILALLAVAVVVIAAWAVVQLHVRTPLVDIRLLRHPAVLTANVSAFVLGAAMYLFLSSITAFVQVPVDTGFGLGGSVLTAGLCLVPFSFTSLAASRTLPWAARVLTPRGVLPTGCLIVAGAGVFFALEHTHLWEAFVTMVIVGVGIGYTFAAIPGLIVRAVPAEETGSAMGFYQVVRYIGFAIGSALAASVLAAHTAPGAALPEESGFSTALVVGAGLCLAAAVIAWALPGPAPADGGESEELRELEVEDAELATGGMAGLTRARRAPAPSSPRRSRGAGPGSRPGSSASPAR